MAGLGVSKMQINKNVQVSLEDARSFTEESMKKDFEYEMAERLTKKLMYSGLISSDEASKVSKLNKLKFEPIYKEILD